MSSDSVWFLFGVLGSLLLASSFFSSAETGLISIDRYKLSSKARDGHRGARRVRRLLKRKDRLLGLILIGNNIANIGASVIATLLSLHLLGDTGPVVATAILTVYMLIFAEIAPKTLAALYPEKVAYPASLILLPLSWLLSPLIKMFNYVSNALLYPLGVRPDQESDDEPQLDRRALLHMLSSSNESLPERHQGMLVNILKLEDTDVNDIMIPRMEIDSIDIQQDATGLTQTIQALQKKEQHYICVYQEEPDNIIGILDIWGVAEMFNEKMTVRSLRAKLAEPIFVPERASLLRVLLMLMEAKQQVALVTDEYGAIQGMLDTSLILQEIVGKAQPSPNNEGVYIQADGTAIVDGTANLRDINRLMQWDLPEESDITTLNGLLLEHLGALPSPHLSIRIKEYIITVQRLSENGLVERALIKPNQPKQQETQENLEK